MAKREKVKTYEAKLGGKKVRVTVPGNTEETELLMQAIQDSLSPEAVATIIAYLQPVSVKDAKVQREVEWFREELEKMVGKGLAQLMDEVGL